MRSANLSKPLKGLRPYHALLGLTQASGFAGGFDCSVQGDQNKKQGLLFVRPYGILLVYQGNAGWRRSRRPKETGGDYAGKHIQPQLDFARDNGIEIKFGNPQEEDKPGVNLILPANPGLIKHKVANIEHFRKSLIKKAVKKAGVKPTDADLEFLAVETKTDVDFVKAALEAEGLL